MLVYLICAEFEGRRLYKIGYTRRSVEKRIKEFKTGNSSEFYIIESFRTKWAPKIEAVLHKVFIHRKINGEWFDLTDADISVFKKTCETYHSNLELIFTENLYYMDRGKI